MFGEENGAKYAQFYVPDQAEATDKVATIEIDGTGGNSYICTANDDRAGFGIYVGANAVLDWGVPLRTASSGNISKYGAGTWNMTAAGLGTGDAFTDEIHLNAGTIKLNDNGMARTLRNVDYPFNLTGILYFPKIKERMAIDRNKIQLYCNQMFVTDHVDNIVPDFLTLLHGVIDSPDIPLNVSRSYLQSDANVKKISTYITKKVADRLEEIFKEKRADFESKWDNIKLFIEYGMLSDEKFCERAMGFALLKNTDGKYFSFEDYRKAIEPAQTDKDKKVVYLYASNLEEQYSQIEAAKNAGYDVLLLDCELDAHFANLLEQKLTDARFARVDSDSVDNLIPKTDKVKPEMSEDDRKALQDIFKEALPTGSEWWVEPENLGENAPAVLITQSEFMRRYREMSALGGGMNFYGEMPASYNIKVNMENPLVAKIWESRKTVEDTPAGTDAEGKPTAAVTHSTAGKQKLLHQVIDLALLANGMLKGKALAEFIARSESLLK